MWPVIINGFGICYVLNVCVCCPGEYSVRNTRPPRSWLRLSVCLRMRACVRIPIYSTVVGFTLLNDLFILHCLQLVIREPEPKIVPLKQ